MVTNKTLRPVLRYLGTSLIAWGISTVRNIILSYIGINIAPCEWLAGQLTVTTVIKFYKPEWFINRGVNQK